MRVEFLLGPAGSGKTFRCLAEVRTALEAAEGGLPLVFLAPKQATFQLERELLSDPALPGYTRLQILSFERLAEYVLEQFTSVPPRVLSEEGRVMVLRALLARNYERLRLFHASARLPGFARQLSGLLNELQQHQLSPSRLRKLSEEMSASSPLRDKLHDLAVLLETYLGWLGENALQDPNGRLELAAGAVNQAGREAQFRLGGLWLDGFAELTPQELDLLAALAPHCERATLAFCLDGQPEQEHDWHSMWAIIGRTFRRCLNRLEVLPGIETRTEILPRHPTRSRFSAQPALGHLERCWVWPKAFDDAEPVLPLAIRCCSNPEAEAVVAAREILKWARERGGRFRNAAVLVRSLDGYERVLSRVFARYGIQCFIDRREPISHHPLAELTRYALRTVVSNWEHDDWFGALKTGLVGAEEGVIDGLENVALARGWRGQVWLKPLSSTEEPEVAQRLERCRQQVVPPFIRLAEALGAVQRQPTGRELAEAVRALWDELGVARTLESWAAKAASASGTSRDSVVQAEIHVQAWREMEQWLENLGLAFENTRLPLGDWLSVIEAGLASLTAGVIPPALDEVLIGQVDRSRNPDLDLVLVLGLNETVFPAPPPPPVLLSEYDREALGLLGLTLGLGQRDQIGRERYLGYIACTRARQRVVLTYSQRDLRGQPLNPSPFIQHVQRLFPGLAAEKGEGAPDWRESLHAKELVVPLLKNRAQNATFKVQSLARLEDASVFAPVLARWEAVAASRSRKRLSAGQADKLYGPNLETSISAFEDYAACPFKFFVARGLRAQERQEFEVDPRERGSFQHEILMEFHRRLQSAGRRWRDVTPEEARGLIKEVGVEVQETFREGLFTSAPERRFAARMLIENLQKLIEVLVGWAPQYLFEPQAVEISFGMEEDGLKAWRIELQAGHALLLRGRIDRVDVRRCADDSAYVVVIDYKSSGQELEEVKLVNGLDLQLLAYLGVLRAAANAKDVLETASLQPAGAFYVSLRGGGGSGKTRSEVLAGAAGARLAGYQHRGRFRGDLLRVFDSREQSRGDQFRYSLKKDGGFSKVGNEVLAEQEFLELVDQTESFLRRYGQEIYAGNVRVAPFRHGAERACDHCAYRAVCRFDPWVEPYRTLRRAGAGGGGE